MSAEATATLGSPAASFSPRRALLLDAFERSIVLLLYGWLVFRLVAGYAAHGGVGSLILLPSEGLVVFFFLIRRRTTDISRHPGEWMLALAATTAPLLVVSGGGQPLVPLIGATVMLMGILVQLHAKITLGRSFGLVPANRGLKISGPYRFVRHPMYAGYLLTHLGFLALNPTFWNVAAYLICYGLQVPRLMAEEHFLSRDPAYEEYRQRVRYRLVPGVF